MRLPGHILGNRRQESAASQTPPPQTQPEADNESGAIALRSQASEDPWMAAMRRGDFARAWQISDAVLRARAGQPCHHWPRHQQYIWDGRPLEGKRVLVRCYHGLGDTVQFIRYATLLRRVAREVSVWGQPVLLPLLRHTEGIDHLLPLHDGVPDCGYDADVEIMELAHVFQSTLDTLPATVPYLHVPPTPTIPSPAPGVRHVGIVWQAGAWDERRSLPTALLEPLTRVTGVRLYALQQGPALEEWPTEWGCVAATNDVRELAARMRALDLVITVDSFPAHLAGALGIPTWTLLHADPDWRWMLGRSDSPWYPTMRLFRQAVPGDWRAVIARVAQQLSPAR